MGKRSKREWDPPVFLVALSLDFGLVLGLASVKGIEKGCADQSTNGSWCGLRKRLQINGHDYHLNLTPTTAAVEEGGGGEEMLEEEFLKQTAGLFLCRHERKVGNSQIWMERMKRVGENDINRNGEMGGVGIWKSGKTWMVFSLYSLMYRFGKFSFLAILDILILESFSFLNKKMFAPHDSVWHAMEF